jgi:O-antigen ligase
MISWLFVIIAIGLPWVVLIQTPPINSLANEVVASVGWGLLALWIGWRKGLTATPSIGHTAYIPLGVLLILALMATVHFSLGHLPYPAVFIFYVSYLIGAALVFQVGVRWSVDRKSLLQFLDAFVIIWICTAALNAGYGIYQYFDPNGFYPWIAALIDAGRVFGNIRQPNHYASLMIIALGCTVWMSFERRKLAWQIAAPLMVLFVLGVVLSGSRTGMVGILFVAGSILIFKWGEVKLRYFVAISLVSLLGLFYFALAAFSEYGLRPHFGSERLQDLQGNYSGSRFAAWATAWQMILENLWIGVGVSRFQIHYLLGDWTQQQGLIFANAHNLFLHIAAENGLIVALLAFVAMGVYGTVMLRKSWHTPEARLVVVFVGPVLVHSFFEYPFWYTFFLFPCFFLLGVLSGISSDRQQTQTEQRSSFFVITGSALLVIFPLILMWSQRAGASMYQITETPISQRIMLAQNSFLFRHYADHALLGTSPPEIAYSAEASPIYRAVAQVLFDERLAYHWALQSLINGNLEQAKRLSYALSYINPTMFEDLKLTVQRAAGRDVKGAEELADYLNNPVRTNYTLDQLLTPN